MGMKDWKFIYVIFDEKQVEWLEFAVGYNCSLLLLVFGELLVSVWTRLILFKNTFNFLKYHYFSLVVKSKAFAIVLRIRLLFKRSKAKAYKAPKANFGKYN